MTTSTKMIQCTGLALPFVAKGGHRGPPLQVQMTWKKRRVMSSLNRGGIGVVCESQKKGFSGGVEEKRNQAKKKGKRGKVTSRPSPQEQLKRLQEDEKQYQEEMAAKLAASRSPSPSTSTSPSPQSSAQREDAVVPEQITNRMLKRILLFSGGPVLLSLVLFPTFYYLKKVQNIDIPVWAVYLVQTGIFGGGLLGISYGIISSSWDPAREGSLSGWNEFQANLPLVLDRFRKKN